MEQDRVIGSKAEDGSKRKDERERKCDRRWMKGSR